MRWDVPTDRDGNGDVIVERRRSAATSTSPSTTTSVHVHGNDTVIVIRPVDGHDAPRRASVDRPSMLSFQKLDVYQRSIEFLVFARRWLRRIPKGHGDLVDQLRSSAQSIPQNVAEEAGKTTRADKAKYYTIT